MVSRNPFRLTTSAERKDRMGFALSFFDPIRYYTI